MIFPNLNTARGFSLVEVMVSLVIGLVALLMVVNIYSSTRESHVQSERIGEVMENGRYAMHQIATDLQSLGYVGGVISLDKVSLDSTLGLATDCGKSSDTNWAYDLTTYNVLQYNHQPTASAAATDHTCIAASEFTAGTDVLVVKRVFGEKETGALTDNNVFIRSDLANGCLWFYNSSNSTVPGGSNCPTTGFDDWRYLVNIYFIRPYAQTSGDGIPTLCKKYLTVTSGATPQPTMQTVCLAEGVERFHVEFGIDTDATPDGVANQFLDNPSQAQLNKAVSARIHVLARARREDKAFPNAKTYTLGSDTFTMSDNYYRRLYSTTVLINNRANLIGM
jgi:type IV pilus assembly protein PilW